MARAPPRLVFQEEPREIPRLWRGWRTPDPSPTRSAAGLPKHSVRLCIVGGDDDQGTRLDDDSVCGSSLKTPDQQSVPAYVREEDMPTPREREDYSGTSFVPTQCEPHLKDVDAASGYEPDHGEVLTPRDDESYQNPNHPQQGQTEQNGPTSFSTEVTWPKPWTPAVPVVCFVCIAPTGVPFMPVMCGATGVQEPQQAIEVERPQLDGESPDSDADQVLPSVGSAGHPQRCAAACKYFQKSKGCKDGEACDRCHLCAWKSKRRKPKKAQQDP